MVQRSSDRVWDLAGTAIIDFVQRWHSPGIIDRAVGFMVRTGRPEYAPVVRELLGLTDRNSRIEVLRTAPRFHTSVLGTDADKWVASLPEDARADILSEIVMKGDIVALEFATAVAEGDSAPAVRIKVIEALAFRRANRLATRVLKSSPNQVWHDIAARGYPDQLDEPEVDQRLRSERTDVTSGSQNPLTRLRWAAGVADDLSEIVANLIADPTLKARDPHVTQVVLSALQSQPNGVFQGLVRRLEARIEIPFRLNDELRKSEIVFEDGPIVRAVLDPGTPRDVAQSCAALIGPETVSRLLDDYFAVCRRLQPGNRALQEDLDHRSALMGLLCSTPSNSFVNALISRGPPDMPLDIGVLSDLFDRHGTRGDRPDLIFAEDQRRALVTMFQQAAQTLLFIEPPPRNVFCELARAIGRLGSPDLLSVLEQMLDKDLFALREQQDRPGIKHLYTNQYSRAFQEIGPPHVLPILIARLREVEFGFAAATVLKNLSDQEAGRPNETLTTQWPDFATSAQRRKEKGGANVVTDIPPVDAIFDAVAHLRGEKTSDRDKELALSLAIVGITLPHGDHREDIEALLRLPFRERRLRLLQALVSQGETISNDHVLTGIEQFFEEAQVKPWILRDYLFELQEWLALLPFTDRPEAIIEAVAQLPDQIRNPAHLHRLLSALAHAPGELTVQILLELAEQDTSFYHEYEWLQALKTHNDVAATQTLLDLIADGRVGNARGHMDVWSLARDFAGRVYANRDIRALLGDVARNGRGAERAVASMALVEAPDAQGIKLMIDLYAAEGKPFDGALGKMVRKLALAERAHDDWAGAYELVPEQLNGLRMELFAMTAAESATAVLASACLDNIGAIRDEYGAPKGERRHPDIASNRPWPLSGQSVKPYRWPAL